MIVQMCDPPSGWRYGFPRVIDKQIKTDEDFKAWLRSYGYPEELMELAVNYSRYWYEDINEPEN